jgi:hypothetical protein
MTENMIIQVEADMANAYDAVSVQDQKKIQMWLRLWLPELNNSSNLSLKEILDALSDRAQARGLTPETLESLLHES